MLLNEPDNSQNCPFSRDHYPNRDAVLGLTHVGPCNRVLDRVILDRFSRFCTAHQYDQHTDRQTALRATPVALGRIPASMHCVHACDTT